MITYVLILLLKVCKLFRKPIFDVTGYKSFGLEWTAFNEVLRCIAYMIGDIFSLLVYKNILYEMLSFVVLFLIYNHFTFPISPPHPVI